MSALRHGSAGEGVPAAFGRDLQSSANHVSPPWENYPWPPESFAGQADNLGLCSYDCAAPGPDLDGRTVQFPIERERGNVMDRLDWLSLHKWLIKHVVDDNFRKADTIMLLVDTQSLSSYGHFQATVGKHIHQRLQYKRNEKWHAVFVPICAANGLLHGSHMTHAVVHVARSLRARFPGKHILAMDADACPTALSEFSDFIALARSLRHLRGQDPLPDNHSPGILFCNEKGALMNAGLILSPGVGESSRDLVHRGFSDSQDFAHTAQAWTDLLEQRLVHLISEAASVPAPHQGPASAFMFHRAHTQALASGTPLLGIQATEPQDYLHLWSVQCEVLSIAAWAQGASRSQVAKLGNFSPAIRDCSPFLGAWAGPFMEQPGGVFLEAFETEACYISYFSAEMGFMRQVVNDFTGKASHLRCHSCMPPLFVHGYGKRAKQFLEKIDIAYWATFSEALQGSLWWYPCFLDQPAGKFVTIQVSTGFHAIVEVPLVMRQFCKEEGWHFTEASFNELFGDCLRDVQVGHRWPLLQDLMAQADPRRELSPVFEPVHSSQVHIREDVRVSCPGAAGDSLFAVRPHVAFENPGNRFYGPTREWFNEGQGQDSKRRRHGDFHVNALHFILRDPGCRTAWNKVLPNGLFRTCSADVKFCPPWLAPPCEAHGFAIVAVLSQFTVWAAAFLKVFDSLSATAVTRDWTRRSEAFHILGFSKGSYTGMFVHRLVDLLGRHSPAMAIASLGALACPPHQVPRDLENMTIVQVLQDTQCVWQPDARVRQEFLRRRARLVFINTHGSYYSKKTLGNAYHNYSELLVNHRELVPCFEQREVHVAWSDVVTSVVAVPRAMRDQWAFYLLGWGIATGEINVEHLQSCLVDCKRGDVSQKLEAFLEGVGVNMDKQPLSDSLKRIVDSSSQAHLRFLSQVVLPWMVSGGGYGSNQFHSIVHPVKESVSQLHCEVIGRLGRSWAVFGMYLHGRQSWACWHCEDRDGFFPGEMISGTLTTEDAEALCLEFSGVVLSCFKHACGKHDSYQHSYVKELQLLVRLGPASSSNVDDPVQLLGKMCNSFLCLSGFTKAKTRVTADPRWSLIRLPDGLLRSVFGDRSLCPQPIAPKVEHPRAADLAMFVATLNKAASSLREDNRLTQWAQSQTTAWPDVQDHLRSIQVPAVQSVFQALSHLSAKFHETFWKMLLQPKSPLIRIATSLVAHLKLRRCTCNVQGFPGSGKTTQFCILAIVLAEALQLKILWTALNNAALREASVRMNAYFPDKHQDQKENKAEKRKKCVRLLSRNLNEECALDVPFIERQKLFKLGMTQKIVLVTEDGLLIETSFVFSQFKFEPDFVFHDEAQQGGKLAYANAVRLLHAGGLEVNFGDPRQSSGGVDGRNPTQINLMKELRERDPGIRNAALQFVPVDRWSTAFLKYLLSIADVPEHSDRMAVKQDQESLDLRSILDILCHVQGLPAPLTANEEALRANPPPQLTLSTSFRLLPFLYALTVAAGYDELVHIGQNGSLHLGTRPDTAANMDSQTPDVSSVGPMPEVLWVHPDRRLRFDEERFIILSWMAVFILRRGASYTTKDRLGVIVSTFRMRQWLEGHFKVQESDALRGVRTKPDPNRFVLQCEHSLLWNLFQYFQCDSGSITLKQICDALLRHPWIVAPFVGITTQVSGVGVEFLDAIAFKSFSSIFHDQDEQNIVRVTRVRGNLLVFEDLNRHRGFISRFAAVALRCCPFLRWQIEPFTQGDPRQFLLKMANEAARQIGSLDTRKFCKLSAESVVDQIQFASGDWYHHPLAVVVRVGNESKLLMARLHVPPDDHSRRPFPYYNQSG